MFEESRRVLQADTGPGESPLELRERKAGFFF